MEKVVIYNNAGRRRAFVMPMIGMLFIALIMGFAKFSVRTGELKRELFILAVGFIIALVFGAVSGLMAVIKMPKMKITLNESDIEVVRGSAKGIYRFEDFIECRKQTVSSGRSSKTVYSLVFEDEDGEELFIDCLGFDYYDILGIADMIRTSMHDGSEDVKDTLHDDRFTAAPDMPDEMSETKFKGFLAIGLIAGLGITGFFVYRKGFPDAIPLIINAGLMVLIAICMMIMLKHLSKGDEERSVKEIVLDPYELKVNEKTWSYGKIRKIYITPPYLTRVDSDDSRDLAITGSDSEEPVVFNVDKRPDEYDPSDEYTKLYNSIIDLCGSKGITVDLFRFAEKD